MADEQNVVKRIVWGEVFSFPHIFKSFKMAVHPSKLALGLVLLILLFGGGCLMDWIWSWGGGTTLEGEICARATMSTADFTKNKDAWDKQRLGAAANLLSVSLNNNVDFGFVDLAPSTQAQAAFAKAVNDFKSKNGRGSDTIYHKSGAVLLKEAQANKDTYGALIDKAETYRDQAFKDADGFVKSALKTADEEIEKAGMTDEQKDEAFENLAKAKEAYARSITTAKKMFAERVRQIEGIGIFTALVDYERDCLYNAIMSVRYLNFTGGLSAYQANLQKRYAPTVAVDYQSQLPDPAAMAPVGGDQPGMLFFMLMAAEGVNWLVMEHWIYATIYLVFALAVWALVGGAIYRIAAVHFAREEKISMCQALRFSQGKFLSFFSAPLVPIAVILGTGGLLALGGLLGSIPVVGPMILSILFFLAILLGIGVAFMTVGLIGGAPLMYPTIAVEGSDSFDAISRSFSYIFARPFRAIFYGVIVAIYGTITYLFVRLFAFIALSGVHCFVKWGLIGGGSSLSENADMLDVLWAAPTFWNLHQFNWAAMDGWDKICAIILSVWVYLFAGLVSAYLITFFASSTTAAYYILRRRVDATDLDDVYIEEPADEETPLPTEAAEKEEPVAKEETPAEDKAEEKDKE